MVKTWLKTATGLKVQQFDIQQQALKLTANRYVLVLSFSTSLCSSIDLLLLICFRLIICAVCMGAWDFPTPDSMQNPWQNL